MPPGDPAARPSNFGSASVVTAVISRSLSMRRLAAAPATRRDSRCDRCGRASKRPGHLEPDDAGGDDAEADDSACLHKEARHHDPIGLRIGAEQEYVFAGVGETTFRVERPGAIVPFPYAQPERLRAALRAPRLHALHQRLRDAAAMPRRDRRRSATTRSGARRHAFRNVIGADLRVGDATAALLDQQRRDVTIGELARLLIDTVGALEMQRHVGGVVGRRKVS